MKIISTNHRGMERQADLFSLENSAVHLALTLENVKTKIWLSHMFIRKDSVEAINEWVGKSLKHNPVPEVGGFLLGKYAENEDGLFLISVEEFVPAKEVNKASPSRIEFGIKPFIDLDKILEKRKDLMLVGWFHTHPGHTPYLSEIDLYSHNGFFPQNYQVAIVLDPLTENYDTGIFCRTEKNTMTNKDDFSQWLNWKNLTKPKQ